MVFVSGRMVTERAPPASLRLCSPTVPFAGDMVYSLPAGRASVTS